MRVWMYVLIVGLHLSCDDKEVASLGSADGVMELSELSSPWQEHGWPRIWRRGGASSWPEGAGKCMFSVTGISA
jgi:hypothetical protein